MATLEETIKHAISHKDEKDGISRPEFSTQSHVTFTQKVLLSAFIFTILIIIVMSQATIDIVVSARGEILLERDVEKVQHLEGGMLESLLVKPGDIVYAGQEIATITSLDRQSQLATNNLEIVNLALEIEKFHALIDNRAPVFDTIDGVTPELINKYQQAWEKESQKNTSNEALIIHDIEHKTTLISSMKRRVKSSNAQLALIREQLTIKNTLYKEEMASYLEVLNMKVQESNMVREIENLHESIMNENFQLQKMEIQLEDLRYNRNSEYFARLNQNQKDLALKLEQVPQLADKVNRLTVLSPVDGIIDKVNYNYISAVISPGDSIADISPIENNIHGEAQISRKDLGFIEIGQTVKVKLDTYNFAKYGFIEGTIYSISRTSYEEEEEEFYIAKIALQTDYLERAGVKYNLSPHMEFTADIKTGDRKVIDYAMKPVMSAIEDSFDER
ncbi:HlyD family type I secretion periplasmic adaptor subunit [Thaumasiovibrio subtropicus]|uniref:HlyD family type I secretion periplasmic adaptor subunit n=1 Tax=Thaumasiovibrio subtropicus TaxID=1891207 RepID=UPI000B34E66E|nr:HlyD family type I secretion periplasmic adaptor subunit [Thaumasiovibrio subtropicus]